MLVRQLIGILLLIAILLAVGDIAASTQAHTLVFRSLDELIMVLDPTLHAGAAGALPASLVALAAALSTVLAAWAMGWRPFAVLGEGDGNRQRAAQGAQGNQSDQGAGSGVSVLAPEPARQNPVSPLIGMAFERLRTYIGLPVTQSGGARAAALSARPTPPAPPAPPAMFGTQDREFLPAALEILVTPASPVAIWFLLLICMLTFTGLAWSYFGWLDIHAVAPGKIQPSGRTKFVQSLEPGRVVAIRVENGARVTAGDVLLELDPTELGADRDAQARDLEAASAEVMRRRVAITAAESHALRPAPIAFGPDIGDLVRRREGAVLVADLAEIRSTVAGLRAQLAEKQATKLRLNASIEARQKLIALARERVGMREEIEARGAGSRAQIIEAQQQLETQITTDVGDRGQLLETDAAIVSLEQKMEEAVAKFVADQTQKLAEIERKRDRLEQELIKAQSKRDRTQLKAPITGIVQQLTVNTIGQVVTSGQALMMVVPVEGPVEVEAMIANKDIGFVKAGQGAIVKVEAFPFTRYGAIEAEVVKISRDAVDEREANAAPDAQTNNRGQGAQQATPSRAQSLVFPATLRLARRTIDVDGAAVALTPGMAVTVEIKTGERRAIDYVLSPLRETMARTAHER